MIKKAKAADIPVNIYLPPDIDSDLGHKTPDLT
jgi:hypothetical protein